MQKACFLKILLYNYFCFTCVYSFAQVGIGTSNPDVSAKFEINSTTQGFLPPRMTSSQRDAIGNPATGLVIFNTTTNGLEMRTSSAWVKLVVPTDNVANVTGTVAVINGGTGVTSSTGSGSVVLSNSPSLVTPSLGAATASSLVTPSITGGPGTTQALVYKTTSGVGTTGADHIFQVGSNGGTEAMRITNDGSIGVGTSSPTARLEISTGTQNVSGLKFSNLNSSTPVSSGATLGVDASGNVVTVAASSFSPAFGSSKLNSSIILPPNYEQQLISVTLPTAGTYLINYTMRVQSAETNSIAHWAVGYLSFTPPLGTPIVGTEILGAFSNPSILSGGNYSGSYITTTTTSDKVVYFIARAFGDTMHFLDDENGRTTITYIKLSP